MYILLLFVTVQALECVGVVVCAVWVGMKFCVCVTLCAEWYALECAHVIALCGYHALVCGCVWLCVQFGYVCTGVFVCGCVCCVGVHTLVCVHVALCSVWVCIYSIVHMWLCVSEGMHA